MRPYQDVAINKALWQFAQGDDRVLLLMATGTGKTFTIFQLIWKLLNGKALKREHVLFLTDRNSLKDQAYRAFSAFSASERVQIDKETVAQGQHQVGKVLGSDALAQRFRRIFGNVRNYSRRGVSFAKVVQQVDKLHFSSETDVIVLSEIYEDLLKRVAADFSCASPSRW